MVQREPCRCRGRRDWRREGGLPAAVGRRGGVVAVAVAVAVAGVAAAEGGRGVPFGDVKLEIV